jgi:transcriptional regulator with XRE-family HTH domain
MVYDGSEKKKMGRERVVEFQQDEELPLGSRIRLLRKARGMRVAEMARELGYDRGHLSNVELNRARPSDELLERIASLFHLTPAMLRTAPISHLERRLRPHARSLVPAAPPLPQKPRQQLGQRVDQLVVSAHLSDVEREILDERLVPLIRELIGLLKAARSTRS